MSAQTITEAFDAAEDFLNPVLQRDEVQKNRGSSLIEILSKYLPCSGPKQTGGRSAVIGWALELLSSIHSSYTNTVADDGAAHNETSPGDPALEDAKRRRILHALLDLISLEGIYPCLSSGAGIPLQDRVISVLPSGVIAKSSINAGSRSLRDETLLVRIIDALLGIVFDARPGIQPVIRGRILSDLISGTADLSLKSQILSDDQKSAYHESFIRIIDETPTSVAISTLSSFLQADSSTWFKSAISGQISRMPLREDGVLQTVLFMASQFAPSLGQEAREQMSNGPHFTVQGIMQMSKLLSSVPQDMNPAIYFQTIAPQLLALIDSEDADFKRAASYIIGNGILGKRSYGAAGTIGHSIFVEPVFKALTASLDDSARFWMSHFGKAEDKTPVTKSPASRRVLVDEETLQLALDRLSSLSLLHPNPGLVKRLVHPVLLPLWGLICYASEQRLPTVHQRLMTLLQTYFSISVGDQPLKKLVDNLLWNGGSTWTYGVGPHGRALLQNRMTTDTAHLANLVQLMETLDGRVETFLSMLASDPRTEERTGDIFLYVSRTWLIQPSRADKSLDQLKLTVESDESEELIRKLVSAKLAEKLLDGFKDTLSRRPLKILELVKQLIGSAVTRAEERRDHRRERESGKVSLTSVANILEKQDNQVVYHPEQESSEELTAVFSLLSTILASPGFPVAESTLPVLQAIKSPLDRLIPYLPSPISRAATTASMLLEIHINSPEDQAMPHSTPSHADDLETHRQALANLNSELPPVQAEGLSLLGNLIQKSSPVLDIPATLVLLLSIIIDPVSEAAANEEFLYLNAIKLIGTLASRHSRTVMKSLVDRYCDRNEERSLDQRLKLGECLLRTVQDLGEALTGETAKILGDGMVSVAGRRGRRPRTQGIRKRDLEKERRQKLRDARVKERESALPPGWKISAPISLTAPAPANDDLDSDDPDTKSAEQATDAANILSAWAAGAAADEDPEDLRVRASAMSILASAIQTNLAGLGPSIASSAVDLALSTLTLEPGSESAILRRASLILLLDILKAIDQSRETRGGKAPGFGFSFLDENAGRPAFRPEAAASRGPATIGNIPHILRTLHFVESREADSIVRGHLRVLIESFEAWMEKSLRWGIGTRLGFDEDTTEPPQLELGNRIAGLRIDPLAGKEEANRPRIEEIE